MKFQHKNPLTAIIVDDARFIRTELNALLKEHPQIKVIGEASNGREAVEVIRELNPDVVFLDINLPIMSGFEVLHQVEHNFKIIFISSYNKFLDEVPNYNAVDFLMKPINKEKLNLAVKKLDYIDSDL